MRTFPTGPFVAWAIICAALLASAATLVAFGDLFAWERSLASIPALWLTGGLMAAGAIYLLLVPLIRWTLRDGITATRPILALILLAGLAMRIIMIPSMPALEDDFYRYLWDGAVTAEGHNPYKLAPASAREDRSPPTIQQLAAEGALVLDRVNHPHIKTIYPPVAEALFAVAHWIEPWSLRAWRLVCLLGECATLALLLYLLGAVGRSPLWASLYWLNPLVVKELLNSAHMEAIVMPFVLAAVALLVSKRPVWAATSLGLAIGAKLWPVMLLPLVLRPLLDKPWRLLAALAILGAMAVAWVLPPFLGGLGSDSGFVAYAKHWQTNSAFFQGTLKALHATFVAVDLPKESAGTALRLALAAIVLGTSIWLSRPNVQEPAAIVRRCAAVVILLFLLSPAQFPWYASWPLVFAPFAPLAGLIGLTVFLPLYYASFYFFAIDDFTRLYPWLVWVEWLPIWALFALDGWREWRRPLVADLK